MTATARSCCSPARPARARPGWPPSSPGARTPPSCAAPPRRAARPRYGPLVAARVGTCTRTRKGLNACGPLRSHLARLLPELGEPAAESYRDALRGAALRARERRPRVCAARRPAVVRRGHAEALAALAESVTASRLLILGSYRSDGLPRGHGLRRLRNDLRRAGRLERSCCRRSGSPRRASSSPARPPLAPEPDLVRAIHDRTEGVPFFARELAIRAVRERRAARGPGRA